MIVSFIINFILISSVVLIHYEVLRWLSKLNPKVNIRPRIKVVLGVIGTLVTHMAEVWVFAIALYFLSNHPEMGTLTGAFDGSFFDCVYFSFSCYTSLGFGDIVPTGWLRFTAATEALTGLVLIAWTASFMFIEMQRFWDKH